jgi:hypothetical protein
MPPSLQINTSGITVWEDEANRLVQSRLHLGDPNAIQVQGATAADRIRITGVADPVQNADVSSKAYVDVTVQGLRLKDPARVATRSPQTLSGLVADSVVDGVPLAAGDRVLCMGQVNGGENGLWVVQAAGGYPLRPVDFGGSLTPCGACGTYVFVDQGDTLAGRTFVCTAHVGADVVGEAADLPFVQAAVEPEGLVGFGLQAVEGTRLRVDTTAVPWLAAPSNAFAGDLVAPRLTGLTTGAIAAAADAVNLEYLETVTHRNTYKAPVSAATVADLPDLGAALAPGLVLDGVVLAAGTRVLVKDQAVTDQNGIYGVTEQGPVRTADLTVGMTAAGSNVPVLYGTTNAITTWVCVNASGSDVVGTDALQFAPLINPRDIPWLRRDNAFTANNTFDGLVRVTNGTESTSQTTGALRVDGGVGVAGNVFCQQVFTMSDERLKENLVPLAADALDVVDRLRGYEFTWNAHPDNAETGRRGRTVGLIAQEVEAAGAPLAVLHNPETDLLAVDYTKLVPYLVESVRTLKRRCDALEEVVCEGSPARGTRARLSEA